MAVAISLSSLGIFYLDQGKYKEAESLHQWASDIWEKAFGAEHPGVAVSLNNLGEVYQQEGKYSEAELLYQRALQIFDKTLDGSPRRGQQPRQHRPTLL